MSRRNLIIVAVLVNAGLLIVLCISALKSDDASEVAASAPTTTLNIDEMKVASPTTPAATDEVDQILNQFAKTAPVASDLPLSSPTAAAPASSLDPSQGALNFADDLKAITHPDLSPSASALALPAEKTAAAVTEVKVKKGDVLEKIARVHKTSVEEIMKINNLSSTRLKIGQPLKIPAKSFARSPAKSDDSTAQYYTVKSGDNPWTIAVKNQLKVEELLKLNNLTDEKARRLQPGDKLRIR